MFARLKRWGLVVLAGTTLAAPGTAFSQAIDEPGRTVGRAIQQPFRDLNLIHTHTAPILQQAEENPYDNKGLDDCPTVRSRIVELEVVLGPDIDGPHNRRQSNAAEALAAGAVGNVIALPFGGVIRRLTGAYSQDQAHRRAVLAGMVRRGYLNGIWNTMGCDTARLAGRMPVPIVAAPLDSAAPDAPAEAATPIIFEAIESTG